MSVFVPKTPIGIVGFGTYIPAGRKTALEIAQSQGKNDTSVADGLGISQKSVPAADEDTITLGVEAALDCFSSFPVCSKKKSELGALFVGSESHPYAVKPSGTVIAHALGLPESLAMADLQFACKAGMQSLLSAFAYVGSGMCDSAMAIGADTAQARHGDVLEYSAAAGGACMIVGKEINKKIDTKSQKSKTDASPLIARLIASISIASDTPDFWRRPGFEHPSHAGRFTGEPAYFAHIQKSVRTLLQETHTDIRNITYCGFHAPNAKFPQAIAKKLGCSSQQIQHSLLVKNIGNTYAAGILITFANIVRHSKKGDTILIASYGSGAGSDALLFEVLQNTTQKELYAS